MSKVETIHLVYPHGPAISCPDTIGRHVASGLRSHFKVVQHDWDDTRRITPGPNDVLLGHPHPFPWTIFRRSMRHPGWSRVIAMIPYSHGDSMHMAWADSTVARCDLLLAITGEFWFRAVSDSPFAHWSPKMIHLDLAVDPDEFPPIKTTFNAPGKRKFLYIGDTGRSKNTPYLSQLAGAIPGTQISWAGNGRAIRGLESLGFMDFSSDSARALVAEHDFLITVGTSDANPATILEAMAWGLIPVCTPQSGYSENAGIVNVPLGNAALAVEILERLQHGNDSRLYKMQATNHSAIRDHFNWDRFNRQILEAVESDASPPVLPEPIKNKIMLLGAAAVSPYSFLRPRQMKKAIRDLLMKG